MKTMNTSSTLRTLPKVLAFLVALGCTLPLIHAKVGEQENWYLAKEIRTEIEGYTPNKWDQYYSFDVHTSPTTGEEVITVFFAGASAKTFSLEGEMLSSNTLLTKLPEDRAFDIEVDTDGKIYGVNFTCVFCIEENEIIWINNFSNESQSRDFRSLAIGPDEKIYASSKGHKKIYVFDKEGNELSEIGGPGEAPGQFANTPIPSHEGVDFLPNGNLITATSNRLHVFKTDGTFIKRTDELGVGSARVTVSATGQPLAWEILFDQDLNPLNKSVNSLGAHNLNFASLYYHNFAKWTSSGDIVTTAWINNQRPLQIWKRAYRTKGTPTPNVIPQPVVRSVAQRAGTNILDIDFEILDSDDATATAGIIASVDGNFDDLTKLIIPSSLAEGTENKIGQPVATNQTHRVSWYVKGDWSELTGNLKIGLLARDARRNKAVDLHFLELPFSGGKLTISRSPLKDSDISNFLLFELGRGSTSLSIQYGKIKDANGNTLAEQSGTSIISTQAGRDYFMNALGYRWATIGEVAMAKEAATPGTINEFTATNQVKPRNLPGKVNEYGFDVGNHGTRAWWVVKKNEVETLKFSVDHSFKQDLDMNQSNSFYGRALAFSENHHIIIGQGGGNVIPRYFHSQPSTFLNDLSGIIPTDGLSSGFGVSGTIGIGDSEISKAIAIDGDILAVGSSGENAVYLFKLSGPNGERFEQKARITPSSNEQGQYFGLTVALDGNILVVGAPFNNANGYGASGCAYVFRINEDFTYSQLAKLSNPAGEENDQFGYALTVSDGIVAIGANDYQRSWYHGDHGVFLYKVEGDKVRQTQLISPPGENYVGLDHFGNSMAIENNLLFVGSHWGQTVSIFSINTDGNAQFLENIRTPNPTEEGFFGTSIAVHDDMVVIGAPGEYSESSIRDGVAYVYRVLPDGRSTLLDRLHHPESQQLSGFGAAVSITSSGVLVGAPGFDLSETKPNVGSAVLFRFNK
jgi:hypothetical protein